MVRASVIVGLLIAGCGPLPEPEADDAGLTEAQAVPDASVEVAPDAGSRWTPGPVVFADPVLLLIDAGVVWSPSQPAVYPFAVRHSPLTPSVVANLKRIVAGGPRLGGVFSKIGDSNTVEPN